MLKPIGKSSRHQIYSPTNFQTQTIQQADVSIQQCRCSCSPSGAIVYPPNDAYWDCLSLPSHYCELKNDMVANYSTRMSARATKFTEGYIEQIWKAINSDCHLPATCARGWKGPTRRPFSANGSFLGTTQLDLSSADRLNFFLSLALKKGDISPLYNKQLMDIFAEAQALPPTASQKTKDEIQTRFQELLATPQDLSVKNQEEWPDIALT